MYKITRYNIYTVLILVLALGWIVIGTIVGVNNKWDPLSIIGTNVVGSAGIIGLGIWCIDQAKKLGDQKTPKPKKDWRLPPTTTSPKRKV